MPLRIALANSNSETLGSSAGGETRVSNYRQILLPVGDNGWRASWPVIFQFGTYIKNHTRATTCSNSQVTAAAYANAPRPCGNPSPCTRLSTSQLSFRGRQASARWQPALHPAAGGTERWKAGNLKLCDGIGAQFQELGPTSSRIRQFEPALLIRKRRHSTHRGARRFRPKPEILRLRTVCLSEFAGTRWLACWGTTAQGSPR